MRLADNQSSTTSPFIIAMIFVKPNISNNDKAIKYPLAWRILSTLSLCVELLIAKNPMYGWNRSMPILFVPSFSPHKYSVMVVKIILLFALSTNAAPPALIFCTRTWFLPPGSLQSFLPCSLSSDQVIGAQQQQLKNRFRKFVTNGVEEKIFEQIAFHWD